MAILKDLIVHGSSRFLNKIYANEIQTPLIEAESGIIKKLKADDVTVVGLLDVTGQLHTNSWSNSNIATIDGSFYITPTIGSTSGTVTITASSLVFSGTNYAVSSLYLGDGSSITWPRYSKVLVTGQILSNGEWIPLGTLLGQLDSAATATSISIKSIKDNKKQDSNILATLVSNGTTSSDYRNLKVSLYQRAASSTDFRPLGIYMTATGINGRTFLDIYGGVEPLNNNMNQNSNYGGFAEPNVRIGNLQGLPNVGGQTPSGWGIYTDNGYFKGIIAADQGYIGSGSRYWVIANYEDDSNSNNSRSYIYSYNGTDNGTNSITSTVEGIYLGTDGIRNYKDSTHYVTIKDGVITALGVDLTGEITASSGSIGGWNIGTDTNKSLYYGNQTPGATTTNLILSPTSATNSNAIGGSTTGLNWFLSAGKVFGVTTTGALYATSGKIGGWQIGNTALSVGTWGEDNSALICTGSGTEKSIGGSDVINNWIFTAGANFGVTKSGALYASSAKISGNITATSGTIGGIDIIDGNLNVSSINIGSLNGASNYAQKTDVTQAINNVQIGGKNLLRNTANPTIVTGTPSDAWSMQSGGNGIGSIKTISDSPVSGLNKTFRISNNTSGNKDFAQYFDEFKNNFDGTWVFSCYARGIGDSVTALIRSWNNTDATTGFGYRKTIGTDWTRIVFRIPDDAPFADTAGSGDSLDIRFGLAGAGSIEYIAPKLERGNKATDWTPAPEDTQENINSVSTVANTALGQSIEYITGTQTAATGTWTGVTTESSLRNGKTIMYYLPVAGKGDASLVLTLANGTNTAAIPIYLIYSTSSNTAGLSRVTTHYPAKSMIEMTYDEANNQWKTTGYNTNVNTNYVDRSLYAVSLYASKAISKDRIAVLGTDGKLHLLDSTAFDISCPPLYVLTAYAAADVTKPTARATNYTYWGTAFNLTNTHSIANAAANTNVYIVGTLTGTIFTPTTTVLTCTEPTSEDGLYYMLLGRMTTTANAVLQAEHPIFAYKNGSFQKIEAITANGYITDIDTQRGITIKPYDSSGNDYLQLNSDAINFYRNNVETLKIEDSAIRVGKLGNNLRNVYITDSAVQIRNNTSVLAEYGSSIKLYNPTTTTVAVEISSTGASFTGNITATSLTLGTGVTIGINQVANLQTTLNGKQPSGDYATNTALTNSTGWSVIISVTTINYSTNSVTLEATVYKDGTKQTTGFTLEWYKTKTTNGTLSTSKLTTTTSTLSVTDLDASYTCVVN